MTQQLLSSADWKYFYSIFFSFCFLDQKAFFPSGLSIKIEKLLQNDLLAVH